MKHFSCIFFSIYPKFLRKIEEREREKERQYYIRKIFSDSQKIIDASTIQGTSDFSDEEDAYGGRINA